MSPFIKKFNLFIQPWLKQQASKIRITQSIRIIGIRSNATLHTYEKAVNFRVEHTVLQETSAVLRN